MSFSPLLNWFVKKTLPMWCNCPYKEQCRGQRGLFLSVTSWRCSSFLAIRQGRAAPRHPQMWFDIYQCPTTDEWTGEERTSSDWLVPCVPVKALTRSHTHKHILMHQPLPSCYWFPANTLIECWLLQYYILSGIYLPSLPMWLWLKCVPFLSKQQLYPLSHPLIDQPGQFISHCDSFLYSLGRQGKLRGM